MTADEVRFLLARFGAAYGRRRPGPDVIDEWERALRRYPASDAHRALDRLIDDGQPGPNLATFVAHVRAQQPPEPAAPSRPPPRLLDPLDEPEPDLDALWQGPTDQGRALIADAWRRLATAPEWRRPRDAEPEPWQDENP